MTRSKASLDQISQTHIHTLAVALRYDSVVHYRCVAPRFLCYLHDAFPQLHRLSQLRRDPHLLGWFRCLREQDTPLCNKTREDYLLLLRRLLDDLAANGYTIQSDLIRRQDFPPRPQYLPRPLPPQDDPLLRDELRRTDDLPAHALLLTRATGIRFGECIDLALDSSTRSGRTNVHCMSRSASCTPNASYRPMTTFDRSWLAFLFCAPWRHPRDCKVRGLPAAAKRAGCACPVTPHRLRHSYASEMLRLGVSLPALMQLLGRKDIRMTLRYVQVTQQDLQRQFHTARERAAQPHRAPVLSVPNSPAGADLPTIRQALAATRHLLEMYRRRLDDSKIQRKLQRLDKRLLAVALQLDRIATAEK